MSRLKIIHQSCKSKKKNIIGVYLKKKKKLFQSFNFMFNSMCYLPFLCEFVNSLAISEGKLLQSHFALKKKSCRIGSCIGQSDTVCHWTLHRRYFCLLIFIMKLLLKSCHPFVSGYCLFDTI